MLRNGVKRDNTSKPSPNIGLSKSFVQEGSSSDSFDLRSAKELNHISHTATSDRKRAAFATTIKNPYWDENHLWKDAFLVYSYKHPEDCLGPPASKSDKTIRFNSRFESGNLLYAYRLNPDVYHCILEYDHSAASQCQWFYFQMTNIKTIPNSNRKMTFYISGFNKASGVFSTGSKVFMYSEKLAKEKNIGWFRTGTNYAYGTISSKTDDSSFLDCENDKENNRKKKGTNKPHKLKRSTLQFQITFPYDDDVVYLCYAQPYTFTDLNSYITNWIRTSPSLITKSTLCKTNGGKDCPLLTITAPNSPSASKKKCIFITARIHPGESNGSIVLHGLIDYLLSKQPLTTYLLDHFIFKIVPMVNIDGVIEGFYRVGLEGEDLNRVWNQPDPKKHPVVYQTKNLIHELNKKMGIAAYIDFHGHSREHGTFAYGCPWEENENLPQNLINKEKVFPKIVSSLCDAFSFEKCVFSIPQKRKDASRCVIRRELGVINSFTIESSFGGITAGLWGNTLYNEFIWKEIGAKIGEGLFHLFSDPSSQTLKTAENQIAAAAALIKPSFTQIETQTFKEKPIIKKKISRSKSEKEENKIVIAIDTQDGIKVISTETKAPINSSNNVQSITNNNGSNSTLKLNHNNTNGITVIQKVEQKPSIETIYTLKITDLSSYSSSSSSSISSARVKRNPRINMNKKLNLNSTLNNKPDSKQFQIVVSNSNENTIQNRRSNLSQRSNVSLLSSSKLNDNKMSSSSSQETIPVSENKISYANSVSKVSDIQTSNLNSSLLDNSFDNNTNNNSILIPNQEEEIQNTNETLKQNEIQKSNSGSKARSNRISKSNSTSNTNTNNTNSNSNTNSESNQSTNTKNGSDMISNKIIKPNSNSNRNSNSGSVAKTKLISKPNANTSTKVSIINNPNSPPQNFVPNPPSNRNENQKPNPHAKAASHTEILAETNPNIKPCPPSNPPSSHADVEMIPDVKISRPQTAPSSSSLRQNYIANQQATSQNAKQSAAVNASNAKPNMTQTQNASQNQAAKTAVNSKQQPTTEPPTNAKQSQQSVSVNSKTNQPTNQNQIAAPNSKPAPPSAATKNTSVKQQSQQTNSSAKTNQQQQNYVANQAANQVQPPATKNSNVKPQQQQPSAESNMKQNQQKEATTSQIAKQNQVQNTAQTAAPKTNTQANQPQVQAQKPSTSSQQKQEQTTAPKPTTQTSQPASQSQKPSTEASQAAAPSKQNPPQNTKQNQTQNAASNTKPSMMQQANTNQAQTAASKPNTQQTNTNSKPNPQLNTKTDSKPAAQQNSTTTTKSTTTTTTPTTTTATPKPTSTTNSNQNQQQTKNESQKSSTTPNSTTSQKQQPSTTTTTKISQSPSLNKNDSQKQNQNSTQTTAANKIEKSNSKTISDLAFDSKSKQQPPASSNSKPNPRMNHIANLEPVQKPKAPVFCDDDFGSNSYLSTQSDFDSFSFFNQNDLTTITETNLFDDSTATFNSSSTYKSPTKSPKLSPQEKSKQKSQKLKKSQNSKTPKRK